MAEKKNDEQLSLRREVNHFVLSGISATLAYTIVYPLETLKTRTQVHSEIHECMEGECHQGK